MGINNFLRKKIDMQIDRHKEKIDRQKEEYEKLKQECEDLKQELRKIGLTGEVNKAIKEIEIIKGILSKEVKIEKDSKNTVPKKWLSEFFSTSLYMYSKQLSKLTRALLILTTILIILTIIQIIIVLT